jgi:methylglutaconyl-CoA hydratase
MQIKILIGFKPTMVSWCGTAQCTKKSMNLTTLQLNITGPVAQVWLNRPDVRNAFNETVIAELTQTFTQLSVQQDVRAIVLAGHGKAFCAGADLHWMKKMAGYSHDENRADAMGLAMMLRTIYACEKPVIARVHGACFAGGMGLVAACDMAVAAHEAEFCLSEVKLGLIPATISPYVINAMGHHAARRYFLTAEKFTAAEAYRIGFVHEICPAELLDETVDDLLNALVNNSPSAVRQAKCLVREVSGKAVDDAVLDDTAERIAQIRASDEGREGVKSFLEKRAPNWVLPEE